MEESTNTIKASLGSIRRSVSSFVVANRIVLLGGLTALSILLIVWARLGFTLEFSRFYAAPAPAVLTVQCGATQNILTWTLSSNRDSNSILRNRDSETATWVCGGPNNVAPCTNLDIRTFTDTNIQLGHVYRYVHKSGAAESSGSNPVNCSTVVATPTPTPVPTPTPTPTPSSATTPTPTPTPTATACALPSCANPPAGCTIRGGDTCNVTTYCSLVCQTSSPTPTSVVGTPTPTPLPSSLSAVTMVATGANVSDATGGYSAAVTATSDQHISIQTVLQNSLSSGVLENIIVRASLPNGLVYIPGSTVINGVATSIDSLSGGGLSLGSFDSGQIATVTFRVRINGPSFAVGQSQASLIVQVMASNTSTSSGTVTVTVNKAASTSAAGTIQTGPGDATVAALLVSAVMTLLYVSYTRTSVFRRREVDAISHSKDPMDFRN